MQIKSLATLTVQFPDKTERVFHVHTKDSLTIGRDLKNEITLKDLNVSRLHATITTIENKVSIVDDSSTNGTFVNSKKIEGTQKLRDGDVIEIGGSILTIKVMPDEDVTKIGASEDYHRSRSMTAMLKKISISTMVFSIKNVKELEEKLQEKEVINLENTLLKCISGLVETNKGEVVSKEKFSLVAVWKDEEAKAKQLADLAIKTLKQSYTFSKSQSLAVNGSELVLEVSSAAATSEGAVRVDELKIENENVEMIEKTVILSKLASQLNKEVVVNGVMSELIKKNNQLKKIGSVKIPKTEEDVSVYEVLDLA